jgi:hypothetical protein
MILTIKEQDIKVPNNFFDTLSEEEVEIYNQLYAGGGLKIRKDEELNMYDNTKPKNN